MTPEIEAKLVTLGGHFSTYNFILAEKVQTDLANSWSQTKDYLKGVKHLVSLGLAKSRASGGS